MYTQHVSGALDFMARDGMHGICTLNYDVEVRFLNQHIHNMDAYQNSNLL